MEFRNLFVKNKQLRRDFTGYSLKFIAIIFLNSVIKRAVMHLKKTKPSSSGSGLDVKSSNVILNTEEIEQEFSFAVFSLHTKCMYSTVLYIRKLYT